MSILATDLRVFRAVTNNDTAANGGEPSTVESVSGVSGNLFPRVSLSERTSGVTRFRKAFHRVNNADSKTLYDGHLFMFRHTPAVDSVTFFSSTNTETQGDVTVALEDHFGASTLVNPVVAGDTVVEVMPEQTTYDVFRIGERVYITNKATYEGTGEEEYGTISNVAAGTGGSQILTLSNQLVNSYAASGTRISSVMDHGDVQTSASIDSATVAGSGALNPALVSVRQRGSRYDLVTFTFTSATNFTASGAKAGSLGTGTISSTFAPVNPNTSSAYFSIPASAWSGTFQSGDIVVLRTVPAIVPVFYVQQVPALSPAFSGNSFTMIFAGETE
jgi:hypothetical protein